jgi:site-specific recombinase XerD
VDDVDLDTCRIWITHGKGGKDRYVPFGALATSMFSSA